MKYEVGQKVNIGYYGGFHQRSKLKREAKITKLCGDLVYIQITLDNNGTRTMFGTANELRKMEKNYIGWK